MNPHQLREVGRTGLSVTALGFGGATLGNIREAIPESAARETILAALEGGIRFFDTAPWYGLGLSEHRFGHALQDAPRESYVLGTKVGRLLRPPADPDRYQNPTWPLGLKFEPYFDYSGPGLMRSYDDSLQRLGLSRVDALIIHDLDFGYHRDEAGVARCFRQLTGDGGFAALGALRGGGEVRALGAGINTTGFIPRFLDQFDLDFFLVAMPYTLLDQDGLDELNLCYSRRVSVVIGAPFASGVLAGRGTYNYGAIPPDVNVRAERIRAVCDAEGVPIGAVALQFVLAHPAVASVIPGPTSPAEVRTNLAWVRHPIPPALWQRLRSDGLIRPDAPVPA